MTHGLSLLPAQVELGFLVALLVVNLLYAVFFQVSPVNSLGIVIRHIGSFACLSDRVVVFVD